MNKRHRKGSVSRRPWGPGFTLVELLVAMAVTVLVLAMLLGVSSGVMNVSGYSRATMDADLRTRAVMDAIEADLKDSLNQYGYTVLVTTGSNTQLTFLTRNRGPSTSGSNSRCVAVSYRLDTGSGNVMRSYAPILWSDTNPLLTAATTVAQTSGSTAGSSVILTSTVVSSVVAGNILRLEAVPVLDNGSVPSISQEAASLGSGTSAWLSTTVSGTSGLTAPQPPQSPQPLDALLLTNPPAVAANPQVCAITVAVAALDSRSFRLPNAQAIASALASPSPSASGSSTLLTPYGVWSQALLSGSLARSSNNYPKPAIAALRIVQNTFRLK